MKKVKLLFLSLILSSSCLALNCPVWPRRVPVNGAFYQWSSGPVNNSLGYSLNLNFGLHHHGYVSTDFGYAFGKDQTTRQRGLMFQSTVHAELIHNRGLYVFGGGMYARQLTDIAFSGENFFGAVYSDCLMLPLGFEMLIKNHASLQLRYEPHWLKLGEHDSFGALQHSVGVSIKAYIGKSNYFEGGGWRY